MSIQPSRAPRQPASCCNRPDESHFPGAPSRSLIVVAGVSACGTAAASWAAHGTRSAALAGSQQCVAAVVPRNEDDWFASDIGRGCSVAARRIHHFPVESSDRRSRRYGVGTNAILVPGHSSKPSVRQWPPAGPVAAAAGPLPPTVHPDVDEKLPPRRAQVRISAFLAPIPLNQSAENQATQAATRRHRRPPSSPH